MNGGRYVVCARFGRITYCDIIRRRPRKVAFGHFQRRSLSPDGPPINPRTTHFGAQAPLRGVSLVFSRQPPTEHYTMVEFISQYILC